MTDTPSRSQWAKMTWDEAQRHVVEMLHEVGFMTFHEKRLGVGRADGVVIRGTHSCVYVGIIEVKHMKRVTLQTQKNAVVQATRYLSEIHREVRTRYPRRDVRYFIATVYTHDYPTMGINTAGYRKYLPEEVGEVDILCTSPEFLVDKLVRLGYVEPHQNSLDEFF